MVLQPKGTPRHRRIGQAYVLPRQVPKILARFARRVVDDLIDQQLLERAMGIEPMSEAWEACLLPIVLRSPARRTTLLRTDGPGQQLLGCVEPHSFVSWCGPDGRSLRKEDEP